MRIFLTGATGYIGRALARRLVAAGHEVNALVRPGAPGLGSDGEPSGGLPAPALARRAELAQLGVAVFPGDITDRASMREAMAGSDWVIHAAADLDPLAPPARMRAANVQGSENVASLAYKLGVGRLLSISSVAAFGGSPRDGSPADESSPALTPFPTTYAATKHAGGAAIGEWEKRGLRVNTVYPSLVYGPPGKKEGANVLLRQVLKGRLPALVGAERKTSWVFLDDLVEGMILIIQKAPPPGRGFVMAGEVTTIGALVERVAALGGVRAPRLRLPIGVARALLTLGGPYFRMRRRRPPVTVEQLRNLDRNWAFDDGRARAELGWRPRGLEAGLRETVAYLQGA